MKIHFFQWFVCLAVPWIDDAQENQMLKLDDFMFD